MTDEIRKQIRHMGDPHGRHSMGDCLRAADTLERLLAVYEAAKKLQGEVETWAEDAGGYTPAWFDVEEALDAVQTRQSISERLKAKGFKEKLDGICAGCGKRFSTIFPTDLYCCVSCSIPAEQGRDEK